MFCLKRSRAQNADYLYHSVMQNDNKARALCTPEGDFIWKERVWKLETDSQRETLISDPKRACNPAPIAATVRFGAVGLLGSMQTAHRKY